MKQHSPKFLALVERCKKNITEILPKDLEKYPHHVKIDVRELEEWSLGHLPEAIHLSKGIIERDIEKTIPNENTPLIIYCSGGFRSILVAYNLQKMGYKNILSLKGGFSAYQNLSKS